MMWVLCFCLVLRCWVISVFVVVVSVRVIMNIIVMRLMVIWWLVIGVVFRWVMKKVMKVKFVILMRMELFIGKFRCISFYSLF